MSQEMLFELPLPADVKFVQFGEVATLTAAAVHPITGNEPEDVQDDIHMLRGFTRVEHETALEAAEREGVIRPLNSVSFSPQTFKLGRAGESRLVTISQLRAFAATLGIKVTEARPEADAVVYGLMMVIDHIAAALEEQHKVNRQAMAKRLVEAAGRGEIQVRDPQTDLPYKPSIIRDFYDLMAIADVNKWLEAQGVAYRLLLPAEQDAAQVAGEKEAEASESDEWKAVARQIADTLAAERWKRGEQEITARNICDAVATELSKRNYRGKRGPRTGKTVRNEALRGWQFLPD